MSRLLAVFSLAIVFLSVILSCIPGANLPQVSISALPVEAQEPEDHAPNERLSQLKAVLADQQESSAIVADIELLLAAQALNSKKQWSLAVPEWEKVLKVAEGPYLEIGLQGWLTAYLETVEGSKQSRLLPRLVWTDLQRHLGSSQLIDLKVATEVQVRGYLTRHAGWMFDESANSSRAHSGDSREIGHPEALLQPSSDDPLLIQFANQYCQSIKSGRGEDEGLDEGGQKSGPNSVDQAPHQWEKGQPQAVQLYWRGLVSQCSGQAQAAIDFFKRSHPELAKRWTSRALAVEATGRLALLQRRNDQRTEAADTYLTLMELWKKSGLNPQSFGLERQDFHAKKINDVLWAARYRAYIGDYQTGKIFAQRALEHLEEAYSALRLKRQHDKNTFAELKAEAYHILAYRIAIEEGELESARSLSLIARQIPHLNTTWSERFSWSIGLYDYMDGDFKRAKVTWEDLLNSTRDRNLKAQLYFWLARVHMKLLRPDEGRFYLSVLAKEAPLSFYNTVAIEVAGLQSPDPWRQSVGTPKQLIDRLQSEENYQLNSVRADKVLGNLLRRAEILVKAEVAPYSQIALREFRVALGQRLKMSQHPGPYIYLSRLQYVAGQYLQSMGTSATLARVHDDFWQLHPEQLLISYPRPFLRLFQQGAQEAGVDQELLFAISRQESAFKPDARSPADAFGLMQLIKTTARRFEDQLPKNTIGGGSNISADRLLEPEFNIKLGALYVAKLSSHFEGRTSAIIGGYNAGEAAIDMWTKNRPAGDELLFVELIPFGETKNYVKKVWRNLAIYQHLTGSNDNPSVSRSIPISIGTQAGSKELLSSPER